MFCKECGIEVQESWKACPNCGNSINSNTGEFDKPAEKITYRKHKKKAFKNGIIALLIVIALYVIVTGIGSEESGNSNSDVIEDLGFMGQEFSVTKLLEVDTPVKFTLNAEFWNVREDGSYVFIYKEEYDDGSSQNATIFIEDGTEENVLSELNDKGYEDEITVQLQCVSDEAYIDEDSMIFADAKCTKAEVLYYGNEYVLSVKNGCPDAYPNIAYGEAFDNFFLNPEWEYFVGVQEGPDEDGDGNPDYINEDIDIVQFTGECTYEGVDVEVLIQFTLNEEAGTFEATYLSLNDVPQNKLYLASLLETVFSQGNNATIE